MTGDHWQDDDRWEQHSPWVDPQSAENEWEEDLRQGAAYEMQGHSVSHPQSGLGIASLILSLVAGLLVAVPLVVGVVLIAQNPNLAEDDPQILALGCSMLSGLAMAGVAAVLGVIGLFQPDRGKTCAIIGLIFASLQVVGIVGLLLIGLLVA